MGREAMSAALKQAFDVRTKTWHVETEPPKFANAEAAREAAEKGYAEFVARLAHEHAVHRAGQMAKIMFGAKA
jgi:hypothetical protein